MSKPKIEMDIERLLHWAYRDELSKRQTSAAEGIWDRIEENAQRGGIDPGHGAAQRYSHFGLPHPDAERIERAVGALEDTTVDWERNLPSIAGSLVGLVTVNDFGRSPPQMARPTVSEWTEKSKRVRVHDVPRDVIMVATMRTKALVTMHAIRETRPDWQEEASMPRPVKAARGTHPMIVGQCRAKNFYTTGSFCPIKWEPSPIEVIQSRGDYVVWHDSLIRLAATLELESFIPLPPSAPATPWSGPAEPDSRVIKATGRERGSVLTLQPHRDARAAAPLRNPQSSEVRYPLRA